MGGTAGIRGRFLGRPAGRLPLPAVTRIIDLLAAGPTRSLEFFPPRTEDAETQLRAALADLGDLDLSFASVTYGALGSTRSRTRDLVVQMNAEHPYPTMAHLTCVGHTRAQLVRLLDDYAASGVENILALGGDPPENGDDAGDFAYASELVELIAAHPADFSVGVAAHPEVHPRSRTRAADRRHLADKLRDADFAVTQFFFDAAEYERLVEELAALGCTRPVVPGVMPFVSVSGLRRMSAMNGTAIPAEIERRLEGVADADVPEVGIEVATGLCERLLAAGAPGVHLYTLNRSASVRRIWEALGPVG